jgi:hypothetical protein
MIVENVFDRGVVVQRPLGAFFFFFFFLNIPSSYHNIIILSRVLYAALTVYSADFTFLMIYSVASFFASVKATANNKHHFFCLYSQKVTLSYAQSIEPILHHILYSKNSKVIYFSHKDILCGRFYRTVTRFSHIKKILDMHKTTVQRVQYATCCTSCITTVYRYVLLCVSILYTFTHRVET